MSQCATCSADVGKGGILQEDGTTLCLACDKLANGKPAANEVDARNIQVCPKCSAVWNPDQSYCSMCHWDVVTGKHVEVKVPRKYVRVSVDVAGVTLAVIAVVGGYIGYDYYRTSKARENAEALRAQEKRLENERRAEEEQRRAEEKRVEDRKISMQREEARKAEAEALRAKVADIRAKREANQKLAQADAARRRELDAAEARKRQAERDEQIRREDEERRRDLAVTTEQKIELCRQDLKNAEAELRNAQQVREKLQPTLAGFKNRMDANQKLCNEINNAMTVLLTDAQTGQTEQINGRFIKTSVKVRDDFTFATNYLPQFAPENNFEEQALKLKTKYFSAQKEYAAAAKQLDDANVRLGEAAAAIETAQLRCADARAALKDLKVDVGATAPSAGAAEPVDNPDPTAGKGKAVKVYNMKDGTKIRAVSTVVSGDDITIKDENGKFNTISRKDIESEDPAP